MNNVHPIFRSLLDRFSGKPIDKPSDMLPEKNGGICEHCGSETIDHCPMCGAPQCCPTCCKEISKAIRNNKG